MKVDAKLIVKITDTCEQPALVGRMIQILMLSAEEKMIETAIQMYFDESIARLRAKDIIPAIAFFVGLSEETTLSISRAIHSELDVSSSDMRFLGRPERGMLSVPEFYFGCTVGLLSGISKSNGYTELTQRTLGHDLIQIVKYDESKEVGSSACYGGISTAVAEISDKYPHLVSAFLEGMNQCPPKWLEGAYPRRICECFLHQVLSIPTFTLKAQASVLKPVHDRLRFGEPKERPVTNV